MPDIHASGVICPSIIKNRTKAPLLLLELWEYPKFRSAVALSAARLPILDMMLLNYWSSDVEHSVRDFLSDNQAEQVLIRSETRGGRMSSPSRQGVKSEAVASVISEMLKLRSDLVVGVQIAGDIHKNLYNLNMMIDPSEPCRTLFEVSGTGFTARDLNRFGVVHERIEVPSFAVSLSDNLLNRTYRVSEKVYQTDRLAKIHKHGESVLAQREALILRHTKYTPIPVGYLRMIWDEMFSIKTTVHWLGLSNQGAVISLSFILQPGGYADHFYWDVHPVR